MIATPTTLVLGAGTSMGYGFPSGEKLKGDICELFGDEANEANQRLSQGNDHLFHPRDFADFANALRQSGLLSVDAFIERNPRYEGTGAMAIAHCLITYEDHERLFPKRGTDNLYQYIFQCLGADFPTFLDNRLSFITFNYDRSLEHYLYTALEYSNIGMNGVQLQQTLTRVMSGLKIVHVYGNIAPLPWQPGDPKRRYDTANDYGNTCMAAGYLRVMNSKRKGGQEIEVARNFLGDAERVCFLGFGYHKENIDLLGTEGNPWGRELYGTSLGLPVTEVERMESSLPGIQHAPMDALSFLREHRILV